jgi:thiamine biosynthesis lipoprotein
VPVALASVLAGCVPADTDSMTGYAVFGTEVEVHLRDTGPRQSQGAYAEVGRLLQRLHRDLHPWENGALMDLNRAIAAGNSHETTPGIIALIEASRSLERGTGGAFNPAIGALVNLWGFHTSSYPITDPPPTPDLVDALLARAPSTSDLELDGAVVRSTNRAVRLDFSGIAKGLAVQRVCDTLARHDVGPSMVNAGGDVMVCSVGERPWRVAVRAPDGGVLETIEVDRPLAVFTSGNYYRYGEFDGERYAHILDPATGRPVDEIMQATVIDPDPLVADAGATALVVSGVDRWKLIAAALEIEDGMVIDSNGVVSRLDRSTVAGR